MLNFHHSAPVAQLDRASGYEPTGQKTLNRFPGVAYGKMLSSFPLFNCTEVAPKPLIVACLMTPKLRTWVRSPPPLPKVLLSLLPLPPENPRLGLKRP